MTTAAPRIASSAPRLRRRGRDLALLLCVGSLVLFALLAWLAVSQKSPTVDETTHVLGAWASYHLHDYRLDPENPPLWHYWAALPLGPLPADFDSGAWHVIPQTMSARGVWQINTLYRTPGIDPDVLIARGRAMMLLAALASGALLTWWGWKAGGPLAAAAATFVFALDPSMLAHAPLIKNDVALAGAVLWVAYALWRVGQRATWPSALALVMATGVAVTVKFSGLLLAPIIVGVLITRALLPTPWLALGRELATRWRRLVVALGLCAGVAVTTYGFIWVAYGLRFAPTPDPAVRFNVQEVIDLAARNTLYAQHGAMPTTQEVAQHPPAPLVRLALWAESHRLLPHAWLYGFLSLYAQSQIRPGYLMGQYGMTGWWYYYPVVVLVKTPTATLLAGLLATVVLMMTARSKSPVSRNASFDSRWLAACIAGPMLVYGLSAITSVHNAGVRHVFPLYFFAYLCIGLAVAKSWVRWPRATRVVCGVLATGLAIESLSAFPNYIPFFNVASAPHKLYLLSDSNLDWGQDLPLVAEWHASHPNERLYLNYFGHADPGYYGIDYVNLPGGYWYGPPPRLPREPGVIAISAMNLQGTYYDDHLRRLYAPLRRARPLKVLGGGSIYLFRFPLPQDPDFPRPDTQ